jgi:hypothetical protein
MKNARSYESYPLLFVAAANLVTFSVYFLGAAILSGFGWLAVTAFLLYCLAFPVIGYIRSNLGCSYCKQREPGCPAADLFGGKKA